MQAAGRNLAHRAHLAREPGRFVTGAHRRPHTWPAPQAGPVTAAAARANALCGLGAGGVGVSAAPVTGDSRGDRVDGCIRLGGQHRSIVHDAGDDGRALGGGCLQRGFVEASVSRGGRATSVIQRLASSGEADTVHDALRGKGVLTVVEAEVGKPGVLPPPAPDRLQPGRR